MTALVCFCTCPDRDSAQRIAEALVDERLAACVNVLPGLRSVYRWHGAIECADEVMLVIKTMRARLESLTARVAALHPHELPELVAVEIAGGLAAYLDWIAEGSDGTGPDVAGIMDTSSVEPDSTGHDPHTGD